MKHALFALVMSVSACATVTSESTQEIRVVTEPAGAACQLRNQWGSWTIDEAPGNAPVHRSFSPLRITCSWDDGTSKQAMLEPRTRGRAYGNILLFGLPVLVDAGTGYGYEYEPDRIELTQP